MTFSDLPTLNALLNSIATCFLIGGFIMIKKGNKVAHKKFMLSATITSALFLISYLIYHYEVGSVPYPYYDWTRPLYFTILVPHVILAALMVPFILALLWYALKGKFDQHRRLARFTWPVWTFVSITGVLIYVLMYAR